MTRAVRIATDGPGSFVTAKVDGRVAGRKGRLLRYTIRVEKGLPFDPARVAREVERTLSDRRSWSGSGSWRLQLVDSRRGADFSVLLATPQTTDELCAPLLTRGKVSCQNGNRAILNAKRWAFGVRHYKKDVAAYRVYLTNHEVGHVLGHGHQNCRVKGKRAPVMLQQTKGLQGCRANPWPAPRRR